MPMMPIAAANDCHPANQVRAIDDHFGFHPSMVGFERLRKTGN
jgi:uncharacterized protein (DUF1501 family)